MEAKLDNLLRYSAYLPLILRANIHEENQMTALSDAIAKLQSDVAAESSVVDSAEALLVGIKAALDKAIADAANAGASPADLQALSDLSASVGAKTAELSASVAANTPAAPAP